MTKGERTRQLIVERAAEVFNTRGYAASSLNDLIRETGLEKGGIYNHFASKEAIALAAFDHAVGLIGALIQEALADKDGAPKRLRAIIAVFRNVALDQPLPGGCPVLNTAVAAGDSQSPLRDKARVAMTDWQRLIGATVKLGIERGEFQPQADPRAVATIMTAILEGAIMLTRLYDDTSYMDRAIEHLDTYLDSLLLSQHNLPNA